MSTITVKGLQALRVADSGKRLSLGESMYGAVRVGRDGVVSVFVEWRYKRDGKVKTVPLGTWRDGGDVSLKALRDARDKLAVELKGGVDPLKAKAANRLKIQADQIEAIQDQKNRMIDLAAQEARITVRGLFDLWQRNALTTRGDKGSEAERSFKRDVFPLIGNVAVADVTKAHVYQIIDSIKTRATPGKPMVKTAKKTLADLRQMLGYAIDRDYIEHDPTARVKKAAIGKDVERDRVLSTAEIIEFFQKLPNAGLAETSQFALLIQFATITRIGEVLGAKWAHVDLVHGQWILPETKNGERLEVILSDFVIDQLTRLKEITGATAWLFPAAQVKKDQPDFVDHVCEKTVTKQVADRQRPGQRPLTGRTQKVDALVLSGGKWTPHDLRRTGATLMADLGALPDVIEKCLNHTEGKKVKRIYQRAKYSKPMRDAWVMLGDRLNLLQAQARGVSGNVIPLSRAA